VLCKSRGWGCGVRWIIFRKRALSEIGSIKRLEAVEGFLQAIGR